MKVGGKSMPRGSSSTSKIMGNISTTQTLFRGTEEEIQNEVKMVLDAGIDILAPSCGLAPRSPLKNIETMIDARNKFFDQ